MMRAQRKPLPRGDANWASSLQTVGVGASSKSETESLGGLAMTLAGMHLRQLKTGHGFWSSGWEDAEACSSTRTPPTPCSLWGAPLRSPGLQDSPPQALTSPWLRAWQ